MTFQNAMSVGGCALPTETSNFPRLRSPPIAKLSYAISFVPRPHEPCYHHRHAITVVHADDVPGRDPWVRVFRALSVVGCGPGDVLGAGSEGTA